MKIKGLSKNNLDFHLSYYLGRYHSIAPKDFIFTVVSKDKGFDCLIAHICSKGRKCLRLSTEEDTDDVTEELLLNLLNTDVKKLPRTEEALKNYIKSHSRKDKSTKNINELYNSAIKHRKISDRLKLSKVM